MRINAILAKIRAVAVIEEISVDRPLYAQQTVSSVVEMSQQLVDKEAEGWQIQPLCLVDHMVDQHIQILLMDKEEVVVEVVDIAVVGVLQTEATAAILSVMEETVKQTAE
jgi:hypothetical protein